MEHLPEVMKIMQAAWDGDKTKCAAYANFLADKLEKDGESAQARYLRNLLAVLEGKKEPVYVVPLETQSPATNQEKDFIILEHAASLLEKEAQGYQDCCKDATTGEIDWDSAEIEHQFNDMQNIATRLRRIAIKISTFDRIIKEIDPKQFKKRRALVASIAYDGCTVVDEEKQLLEELTDFLDEIAEIAKTIYDNETLSPTMFLNYFRCSCNKEWQELWFWPMGEYQCPECGADEVTPYRVEELSLACCDLSKM